MITITKDKIYYSPLSLKITRKDSEEVKELSPKDIVFYMGEDVELGEDLTFGRFFEILIINKEFFNVLFNSELNQLKIDDFISDFEMNFNFEDDDDFKLRLSWACNYDIDNDGTDLYDYIVFNGYGKPYNEENFDYPFSICFFPLNEIKNKLMFCDNTYEIDKLTSDNNEVRQIFSAKHKPFTLYGIISSILYEITYYGTPENRDKEREEYELMLMQVGDDVEKEEEQYIEELKHDIDKMIQLDFNEEDKTTFWDTLYPKDEPTGKSSQEVIDDVIIALSDSANITLDEQLQEAVDNDDFEKAAKIKKLIDKRDGKK